VNLAAAFVACDRYQEALDLLSSNIEMAKSAGHSRLLANCYEIRGQVYVHQRSFELAKHDLATAKATLGAVKTYDQLFIRKWTSLLEAIKSGDLQPIIEFRKEALLRHEAESVREADRFHLRVEFDDEIYHRLIFGTPAVDYRTRLMAEHSGASVRDSYVFGDASGALLDLASGKLHNAPKGFDLSELSPGRKVHQLLEVLTRDFYRPMRIGALFAELFPNEYFDVYSSPNRVHAWLWHLRQWFTRMSLPLEIVEIRGTYLLKYSAEPSSHFGIEVPLNRERPDAQLLLWQDFAAKMGDGPFTAKSAEAMTGIARTSLQRLINWAINSGRLVREKQGVQVFYRLVDPVQSHKPSLSAA
jgi:tetratricopeptide (TPR) repeat protein